ncbi:hypothetical protein [Ligilactobacillus aviarius]|uniref:Uncharacterized protein n=1 Tax=Ligilactobacillus aviarius TaxID=1606 RepID=A0A510WQ30_9LACO|nr:hypothetical protein [Ligilactobacillus aviarius]KRM38327.1 hypothetical protein FC33_GL000407 [Ligilactobacillus aviarius subsp. aviarius DSM 20655]GEK41322.1 hypothetical protein LAV01_01540 [Ligilactobacillus aviarius]
MGNVTIKILLLTLVLWVISFIVYRIFRPFFWTKLNYRDWMKNNFWGSTFIWAELFITYTILLTSISGNAIFRLIVLIIETFLALLYVNFCEFFFKNKITEVFKLVLNCVLSLLIDYFVISLSYIGFCHYNIKSIIDIDNLLPNGNGSQLTNKDYLSIFMVIIPIAFSGISTKLRKLGEDKEQDNKNQNNK